MENSIRCTVGILTFNSAAFIERCLKSLQGFEEILIADGGSTDETLAIARRFGCSVIKQSQQGRPITDFAYERNRMLDAAKCDWFFYLDSDEVMSPELKDEMRQVCNIEKVDHYVYLVPWKITNADMSIIYPSFKTYRQPRFFHKESGARFVRKVHERIEFDRAKFVPGILDNPWYVSLDIQLDFTTYREKVDHRIRIMVEEKGVNGFFSLLKLAFFEPVKNIAKQLIKFLYLRIRYFSRDLPPAKYEIFKLYSQWVYVREFWRIYFLRVRLHLKLLSYYFFFLVRVAVYQFKSTPEVAVLMYHAVDGSGWKHAVEPAEFERQMRYIKNKKKPTALSQVVSHVEGRAILPSGSVAVTIDDGYTDIATTVLPILKKYNIHATVFVPTDTDAATSSRNQRPRMSWDQIRSLANEPLLAFESHSRTHRALTSLNDEELRFEIEGSRDDFRANFNKDSKVFGYPFGDKNQRVVNMVKNAGFVAAVSITEGLVRPGDDVFAIRRIQVDRTIDFSSFKMRLTSVVDMHRKFVDWSRAFL